MKSAAQGAITNLSLNCAFKDLPYDLGEMPAMDAALAPIEPVGFLESREGTEKWARYGIAAARPIMSVQGRGNEFSLKGPEGDIVKGVTADPLELLRSIEPSADVPEQLSSFRYVGGWVGSLGYEASGLFDGIIPAPIDDIHLPDYAFFLPSVLVIKDAVARRLVLVSYGIDGVDSAEDVLAEAEEYLRSGKRVGPPENDGAVRDIQTSFLEDDLLQSVVDSKKLIHDGELIQVVVSRRWEVSPAPPPEVVYDALSQLNPSPYHFYLRLPGGVLLGASPELLVRREAEALTVRPIAGTRRRGKNEAEDMENAADMLADPKERAEHIMLVDLGRNDLGRVSAPGTVSVSKRMEVEYYSHVMHLVSEVHSKIAKGSDSYDVLKASFPAGTVSGAPKIRAMQAISDLEPVVRGPYAGGVGYFDLRGNMDFCITIRSVFYSGDRAFVQAGAGIVADSVPEKESDEMAAKAQAMLKAFGTVNGRDMDGTDNR